MHLRSLSGTGNEAPRRAYSIADPDSDNPARELEEGNTSFEEGFDALDRTSKLEEARPCALDGNWGLQDVVANQDMPSSAHQVISDQTAPKIIHTDSIVEPKEASLLSRVSEGSLQSELKELLQSSRKGINQPPALTGCRGMLEWSLRESSASPDEPLLWSNPRFFEVAIDEHKRWILRSRENEAPVSDEPTATLDGELEIVLLAITAVRQDRRDPEERIFSVRHRTASGERVECLFRTPNPAACSDWTRSLMARITEIRKAGSDSKLVPRLKAAAQAVRAIHRAGHALKSLDTP
jgi:hypothetical protein